eukprot:scaffold9729_cov108-Isochrysis_galbana.AAC.8
MFSFYEDRQTQIAQRIKAREHTQRRTSSSAQLRARARARCFTAGAQKTEGRHGVETCRWPCRLPTIFTAYYRRPRRPLFLNLSLYHALAPATGVSVRLRSSMSMPLPALAPAVLPTSGGGVCAPSPRPVFGWVGSYGSAALATSSGGSRTAPTALGRRDPARDTDMDGGSEAKALGGAGARTTRRGTFAAWGSSPVWFPFPPSSSWRGEIAERRDSPKSGAEGSRDTRRLARPLPPPISSRSLRAHASRMCSRSSSVAADPPEVPRGVGPRVADDRGVHTEARGLGTGGGGGGEGTFGGGERGTTLRGLSIEPSNQLCPCWWSTEPSRSRGVWLDGDE